MEESNEFRAQQIAEFKVAVVPLLRYLPYFESKNGTSISSIYNGNDNEKTTMSFPVYDQTALNFIKEASKTSLMEKNYRYVYSRRMIKSHVDEKQIIDRATINDWDVLRGILSYYVLGGRVKALLWNEATQCGIFYLVLKKMKEIIEFWDRPIDERNIEEGNQ